MNEIEELKADIDRLIAKCFEQHECIERLEAALRYYAKDYENPFGDDDSLVARQALAGEKKDDAR